MKIRHPRSYQGLILPYSPLRRRVLCSLQSVEEKKFIPQLVVSLRRSVCYERAPAPLFAVGVLWPYTQRKIHRRESNLCSTVLHFNSRCFLFRRTARLMPAVLSWRTNRMRHPQEQLAMQPCCTISLARSRVITKTLFEGKRQGGEFPPRENCAAAVKTTRRV